MFLLGFLALRSEQRAADDCPANWRLSQSGGAHACYFFVPEAKTWDEASAFCAQSWAYLASVQSAEENDFIASMRSSESANLGLWLGGTDVQVEGTWTWSDGEPWNYEEWKENWELDDADSADCLKQHKLGYWNDAFCNEPRPFVCKMAANKVLWRISNLDATTQDVSRPVNEVRFYSDAACTQLIAESGACVYVCVRRHTSFYPLAAGSIEYAVSACTLYFGCASL
eukprot:1194608-Prorocentrum_minimum.AAC.6